MSSVVVYMCVRESEKVSKKGESDMQEKERERHGERWKKRECVYVCVWESMASLISMSLCVIKCCVIIKLMHFVCYEINTSTSETSGGTEGHGRMNELGA